MEIRKNLLPILRPICACFSILANLIIIILFLIYKKVRNFLNTVCFQLAISSFILNIFFLIVYPKDFGEDKAQTTTNNNYEGLKILCQIQSTFISTFYLYCLLFTTIIPIILYLSLTKPEIITNSNSFKYGTCISCWVFGIPLALVHQIFGWEDKAKIPGLSRICWDNTNRMRLISFIVDVILLLINIVVMTLLMKKILQELKNKEKAEEIKEDDNFEKEKEKENNGKRKFMTYFWKLIWYIVIQVGIYTSLIVGGIQAIIGLKSNNYIHSYDWWTLIREIMNCFAGLIFMVVYCYTKEYKEALVKCFCCRKQEEENKSTEDSDSSQINCLIDSSEETLDLNNELTNFRKKENRES